MLLGSWYRPFYQESNQKCNQSCMINTIGEVLITLQDWEQIVIVVLMYELQY